jgi:predicted  nucleic acid-binding Zn-ribbon protein
MVLLKKIEQQNKSIKTRYVELEHQMDEAEAKIKALESDKTYNSLIPTLMQ